MALANSNLEGTAYNGNVLKNLFSCYDRIGYGGMNCWNIRMESKLRQVALLHQIVAGNANCKHGILKAREIR